MMSAFVFIQIGGAADMSALHMQLHGVEGVKTVHFLAGPTDVVAFVETADSAGLMATIGKLRAVNGVASSDTRVVLPV